MKKSILISLLMVFACFPLQVFSGIEYSGLLVTSSKVKFMMSALGDDLKNPDRKIADKMADQACQEKIKQLQSEGKEVLGYEIKRESLFWENVYANCNILISAAEVSEEDKK